MSGEQLPLNAASNKLDLGELGSTGLKQFSGHIQEEALNELIGSKRNIVFKEMEDNDPTIGAIMFATEMLIRQVPWNVEPWSEDNDDKEKADFVEGCMDDMEQPWSEVINEILSMLPFGHAPLEQVFKRRKGIQSLQLKKPIDERIPSSRFNDGLIGWKKLPLRAQETILRWEMSDNGSIIGLHQQAPPSFKNVFIPIEKLLLFRTSTRKNNPEGRSILRNAFRPWFFKKKIENIEGIGIERDLAGLPMAFVPPEILSKNASAEERAIAQKVREIVTNVRRDEQEGIVFPMIRDEKGNQLYDFKLLSTAGSRQFKTSEIINRYRQDIAMSVLADFVLMGHEKVGSLALADSKTGIFTTAIDAWVQVIEDVFNRQAIPMLWRVNGFDMERMPKLSHGDIESLDLNVLGTYVQALASVGIDLTEERVERFLKAQANIPLDEQE